LRVDRCLWFTSRAVQVSVGAERTWRVAYKYFCWFLRLIRPPPCCYNSWAIFWGEMPSGSPEKCWTWKANDDNFLGGGIDIKKNNSALPVPVNTESQITVHHCHFCCSLHYNLFVTFALKIDRWLVSVL
jgi:hypothetical protein